MIATKPTPKKQPGVLVVGPMAGTEPILRQLEAKGRFEFTFLSSLREIEAALAGKPSAVVLLLPAERAQAEEFFSYLGLLRQQAPVVVMSTAPDMRLYLSAMTLGAFDYFTSYTPIEEAMRVLTNAVLWTNRQAA